MVSILEEIFHVMKILYYDCFSGISGDMNLAAMIDLGVPKSYLVKELQKLNLKDYTIKLLPEMRNGISGLKLTVEIINSMQDNSHRHFVDIVEIIESSSLDESIKTNSIKMFRKIAEAESKIHSSTMNDVHFHEVGAMDSIIDIVGAAICMSYINPDRVICSSIELGCGFVGCGHGIIPVPAPATVEILKNIPVKTGTQPFETTTPTGAAILACNVDEFTDLKEFRCGRIGYGIGERKSEIPNVLRLMRGRSF